jgi:hypothetical protein
MNPPPRDPTTNAQRMTLSRLDRIRYFVPTAICVCLAVLCLVLIVTSAFLDSRQNAVAVATAGVFGLVLTGGLGYLFWWAQRRDLLFTRIATRTAASVNFGAVRDAAIRANWKIVNAAPGRRLEAETSVFLLSVGERVDIHFVGNDVLVACICDPSVGFSLSGRRHCEENRELVRNALLTIP